MITAVWSFRNCKGEELSRLDIILPLFSAIMWRRFHPKHKMVLYVDSDYMSEFDRFGLLEFWDEVKHLPKRTDIDISHFWSISKIEAIENESGPIVHVDGDFVPYTSLELNTDVFEGGMGATLLEEILDAEHLAYIDSSEAAEFGGISPTLFEWDDFADQTSLMYLNNDELKSKFIEEFYKYAKVVSDKKIDHRLAYILFIEQKYLRELAMSMGIDKRYLIKDAYKVSNSGTLPGLAKGEFPIEDAWGYFYHYGPHKNAFHRDLEMANHLGTYILPIVNDEELAKLFWNIYAQKPYKEKKVSFWKRIMNKLT